MEDTITSLPAAMLHFFGKLPEQTSAGFMQELKALTDEDKAEFRELLKEKGYKL